MPGKKDAAERFVGAWLANDFPIGDMQREYRFHPVRRWRFDVAWPSTLLAVEIDGLGYGHNTIRCRISDCEKQNAAVVMGWKVFRFSTPQIKSGDKIDAAVTLVWEFMCGVGDEA